MMREQRSLYRIKGAGDDASVSRLTRTGEAILLVGKILERTRHRRSSTCFLNFTFTREL